MVGLYVFPEQVSSLNASLFWPCSAVPFPSSRPAASSPGVFRTKIYTFPSPSSVAPCFQLVVPCRPKLPPGDARCSCGASLPVRAAPASQSLSLWTWGTPNGEGRTSPHALHCLGWGKCRVSVSPINRALVPTAPVQTDSDITSAPRTSRLTHPLPTRPCRQLPSSAAISTCTVTQDTR